MSFSTFLRTVGNKVRDYIIMIFVLTQKLIVYSVVCIFFAFARDEQIDPLCSSVMIDSANGYLRIIHDHFFRPKPILFIFLQKV